MPTAAAVSPDGKRVAFVHTAYGAEANDSQQSLTIASVGGGQVVEYNESRLKLKAKQTFSFGAAFSADAQHLYVPFGSLSDPSGTRPNSTGNAIGVYAFSGASAKPVLERLIPLRLRDLPSGKIALAIGKGTGAAQQVSFPAGLAAFMRNGREKLLVAEQLSDSIAIVDVASGALESRTDVGESKFVPSAYPYSAIVNRPGDKGYVGLWNGSQVVEISLAEGRVGRRFRLLPADAPTGASSHPIAMALSPDQKTLYVALANRDQVAAIQLESEKTQFAPTTPAVQKFIGAYPNALALSADGGLLFVANAAQNSVAVIGTHGGKLQYLGAMPTELYPTALAVVGGQLFVASGKGQGIGPSGAHDISSEKYGPKLEYGSIARIPIAEALRGLEQSTQQVIESNLYREAQQQFTFAPAIGKNPIKHVIYIIKENRTYDQVFGDIKGANGDSGLVMFGEDITPNQHALARQFGVLDNFYDSGEVSGSGHVWSTAAITSDYTERIWPIAYRGAERTYDFEGNVSNSLPLQLGIPDVNEPATGYLWTNLARHHRTYRHYGEFVQSKWCGKDGGEAPEASREAKVNCPADSIEKGMPLPNGGASPYPWKVPVLATNTATKPELVGHFDPAYPDLELEYPDQLRADEFIRELQGFVADHNMPEFLLLRVPNDHTSGAKTGAPTPRAAVADNDLAVGRIVEAVSHSPYWADTAVFILEDDAQSGADHVDAHRSLGLVISKYSPRGAGKPFVESGFYTTVNMIHTMEALLGLPPMNANDAYAPVMNRMFSGAEQPAFQADRRNVDNGMLYEVNTAKSVGARASAKLDFSHADANDAQALNRILWRAVKGRQAMPKLVYRVFPRTDD